MRQIKTKLHPFRILILLIYGNYSWAEWTGDDVSLVPSQLTRTLRVSRRRLKEYFEWLQKHAYISDLREDGRRIAFTVTRPERWDQPAWEPW
jgi:hypothetical protein